ncbi:hypothetical protein N9917_04830 [Deltaproteobacteria bacterium]|nr:hypothetical protein [Deltaproteobacteria bacterium]
MSEPTYEGKTFSEMSRDDLELALFVELSLRDWHNLSHESPDPEAVESYGWGRDGGKHSIHILSKYEDGEIVLVSANDDRPEFKKAGAEQFKLVWLWEQVSGEKQ